MDQHGQHMLRKSPRSIGWWSVSLLEYFSILGDTSFSDRPTQTGKQTNQLNRAVCWRLMVQWPTSWSCTKILLNLTILTSPRGRKGHALVIACPAMLCLVVNFAWTRLRKDGQTSFWSSKNICYTTHANNDGLLNVDQIGLTLKNIKNIYSRP